MNKTLVETFPDEFVNAKFREEYGYRFSIAEERDGVLVRLFAHGKHAATFEITPMRGNLSVLIFHNASVEIGHRGIGLGRRLHELRLEWARSYGATMAMCTALSNNVQNRILSFNGWVRHESALNQKTGNEFSLWTKMIC